MVKVIWISDEEMTKEYQKCDGNKIRKNYHVFGICSSLEFNPINSHHTIFLNTIISRLENPIFVEFIVLMHETISLSFSSPILKLDHLWDIIFHALFHNQFILKVETNENT